MIEVAVIAVVIGMAEVEQETRIILPSLKVRKPNYSSRGAARHGTTWMAEHLRHDMRMRCNHDVTQCNMSTQ